MSDWGSDDWNPKPKTEEPKKVSNLFEFPSARGQTTEPALAFASETTWGTTPSSPWEPIVPEWNVETTSTTLEKVVETIANGSFTIEAGGKTYSGVTFPMYFYHLESDDVIVCDNPAEFASLMGAGEDLQIITKDEYEAITSQASWASAASTETDPILDAIEEAVLTVAFDIPAREIRNDRVRTTVITEVSNDPVTKWDKNEKPHDIIGTREWQTAVSSWDAPIQHDAGWGEAVEFKNVSIEKVTPSKNPNELEFVWGKPPEVQEGHVNNWPVDRGNGSRYFVGYENAKKSLHVYLSGPYDTIEECHERYDLVWERFVKDTALQFAFPNAERGLMTVFVTPFKKAMRKGSFGRL